MEEGDEELLKGQKHLCKHEDLCSNPQNPCKKLCVCGSYPGIMGSRDRQTRELTHQAAYSAILCFSFSMYYICNTCL